MHLAHVLRKNPSQFKAAKHPVEQVAWKEAVEFCGRLSDLPSEKRAGRVYRLPTEAEWEYGSIGRGSRYASTVARSPQNERAELPSATSLLQQPH